MEQTLKQIRACKLCQSELPRPANPILQAHANSKILIAGQAPGAITDTKSLPFDDQSGNRLRSWLNVSKSEFYNQENFAIVPMGFCYPGKGASGDLPPKPICAATWREQLLSQLPHIKLTLILGKYAIKWHLQTQQSITTLAQQWQQQLQQGYMVLPHPSPRNNRWLSKNIWFEQEAIPQLQQHVLSCLK